MSKTAHILEREQFITQPLSEVFAFFERPENLAEITPPGMRFRIRSESPVEMRRGAVIDYTISLLGLRLKWRSRISTYEPPHMFVDVQERGPYALWEHTHTFEEVEGGTLVRDVVRYEMPFGPLGRLAHTLWVRRQLERIFDFRAVRLEEIFEGRPARRVRRSA